MTLPFSPINAAAGSPIYRQIYLRIRQSIADGVLRPGDRVPSVRGLASELNLARGTVESAYQLLIGEGYLIARGPAGTVVSPQIRLPEPAGEAVVVPETAPSLTHTGSMPLPLEMGLPALDVFPRTVWNRLAAREMRQSGLHDLIYPDPQGYPPLRAAIAGYLGVSRGVACSPDQVFICAGYRASLNLICHGVLRHGDTGWFEDPGYLIARRFLIEAGMTLLPVPVDDDGLDVEAGIKMAANARFAVVTPSHQSPLGVSLSLARRHALLDWARAGDRWIIEDDYDGEFRYRGRPLPALKSLDTAGSGRVLYTGTFSKVLAPGLRLSYLVVPQEQVVRFAETAGRMQNQCPRLLQATLARFIEEGAFARHIRKMRSIYADRRATLADALCAALEPRAQLRMQAGGMHLLAMLDNGSDDGAIAMRARSLGLSVQALSAWYAEATSRRGLLIGFTNVRSSQEASALSRTLASAL
ncbi:MAG: PLP-dependent aminotransferase family protein [Paraburkholderia sp.]|uniref:MocR-like pyridoxine biosynthesis transcription factor PdxR n=1 Tax=Paraburkholderia sp. TaxID=1926495 RepID=UPI0011F5C64A|nr:PLP-dependent aminotransferase family protein [Paraburkholderia sp.]TAL92710.1 MAG: PLP-dependent aminotransferase family protein [Paraburkholderia sp.]